MKVIWNKYYLWTTADVILRKQSTYINCSLQSLFTCYHVILKHIVWKSCISDEWKSLVMILNPFIRFDRFEAVNSKTKCSESWSNPAETCCLCCLEERPEALLKADSITDFKNMFQVIYIDTRLTLTGTVLLSLLSQTLNMVFFAKAISLRSNYPGKIWKINLLGTSGIIKQKCGTVLS